MSQEELAAQASVPRDEVRQSDVSRLERGLVALPRRDRLDRIAAAELGLPVGDLLARSGRAGAEEGFAPSTAPEADAALDVLVVLDEPVEAEAMAALLADEGWTAAIATDVAAALAAVARRPPALVVADAALPEPGAAALLERLGGLPRPLRSGDLLAAVRVALGAVP